MMNSYFWEYPEIEKDINKVKAFMHDTVSDAPKIINQAVNKLVKAGGKMLRPGMVILGAKFGTYDEKKIIPIAACIELLHIATLIHDDIIDGASIRRGIASANAEYSKEVAVLIGDYLFAKTFEILADDYPAEMLKSLSGGVMNICSGELIQHGYRFKQDLDIDEYLRMISGKTASLFSMSLFSGAYQAKAETKTKDALAQAGYNLGIAFQIVDDCLDYNGLSDVVGKDVLADLKDGYYTLPLLYALKHDRSGRLKALTAKKTLSLDEFDEIKLLVNQIGGVKKSKEMAIAYSEKSKEAIAEVKENRYKKILENLIDTLIFRDH